MEEEDAMMSTTLSLAMTERCIMAIYTAISLTLEDYFAAFSAKLGMEMPINTEQCTSANERFQFESSLFAPYVVDNGDTDYEKLASSYLEHVSPAVSVLNPDPIKQLVRMGVDQQLQRKHDMVEQLLDSDPRSVRAMITLLKSKIQRLADAAKAQGVTIDTFLTADGAPQRIARAAYTKEEFEDHATGVIETLLSREALLNIFEPVVVRRFSGIPHEELQKLLGGIADEVSHAAQETLMEFVERVYAH